MNAHPITKNTKTSATQRQFPQRRLRWQFVFALLANAVYGACSLLLLVVLNKWGSESAAGQYSLALAITAPIFQFAALRFNTLLVTGDRDDLHFSDYLWLRVWAMFLAMGATLQLAWFSVPQHVLPLIAVVCLGKCSESLCELCRAARQRHHQIGGVTVSLMSSGILSVTAFAATYLQTRSVVWSAVALCLLRVLLLVCYDLPIANHVCRTNRSEAASRAESRPTARRRVLWHAIPLGFTAMLISLTSNVPRYAIASHFGEATLGIYASLAVVLQGGTLLLQAIQLPLLPRLAHAWNVGNDATFWRLLCLLGIAFLGMGLCGAGICYQLGDWALQLFFTDAYAGRGGVLSLLLLAMTVAQVTGIIESALITARVTVVQLPMHVITLAGCMLLAAVWVPNYGLHGAAMALIFCRFPFVLIGVLLLRHQAKLRHVPSTTALITEEPSSPGGTSVAENERDAA